MTNLIGQSLGRYHILEQLGEGGMATVYKALDTRLERHVAVKVIRTDLFGRALLERMLKRFEREAKSLARLSHPNVVKVLDYGEHEGAPFIVMEFIPGGTLKDRLAGNRLPWHESVRLMLPIAQALAYAHDAGIIHRDIKPSNILITQSGEPMLSDFGIAKILADETTVELTATGAGIGTPEYMAPEQGMGHADARADIYALGIVLYQMITGHVPFRADTPMAIMLKKNTEPLPRPSQFVRDLPPVVENMLIKSLARDPENRYPTMLAFIKALEGSLNLKGATATTMEILTGTMPVSETQPGMRGAETSWRGWIPWIAGAALLSACCVAVVVGALAWPRIFPSATPSPYFAADATRPPIVITATFPALPIPETVPPVPIAATALPILTDTPAPARSSGGNWIAFNSRISGNAEIYLVDVNGDNLTQVTKNSAHDLYPSWSPDGRYLVYQTNAGGDQELAIVEIATKKVTALTRDDCNEWGPSWSPDGEWIAFYSDCKGERNIYKMRTDGSDLQQLTFGSGSYSWFPSWSPDGTKITFSSNRSGNYQVFVMKADGSNPRALADGCVSYYSPDGSQILYGVYCTDTDDLWLMNADGSNQHRITSGYQCKNATWSPDGTRIVFQVSKSGKDGPFAQYIMPLDDPQFSNWLMLTDYNTDGGSPVWQP
jgi:Tol biopolymer transport system component/tRNA A-37 threonylcarbamoyl transferase component Bud32